MAVAALPYLNRELSMLEFQSRVLFQAEDARHPLLERAKFLAIFANNLDDFFQIRVAGLRRQLQSRAASQTPDGMTPAEQLAAIRARVEELTARASATYGEVRAGLAAAGVRVVAHAEVPQHHARLRERFVEEVFPVL